ncbi:MAG: Abi family protein [Magnetococcales bacterium]|nr:Abi family protein [Magnetococcales bacterium]
MAKIYAKPPLTFDQQLDLLISRGMVVDDRDQARRILGFTSYYRLSGYWYPFRIHSVCGTTTDQFQPGSHLAEAITLYEFDRNLRLLVMDAIERVEIAIRAQITYRLAHTYGTFAHTDPVNFQSGFRHGEWLAGIEKEAQRSTEPFIRRFKNTYQGFPTLPIWMATEVMSFGALSILFKGMKNPDRQAVSRHFTIHHMRFGDNLHVLTYIRNICAHHGRLWNRELAIKPHRGNNAYWQPPLTPRHDRIFYALLILGELLAKMGTGAQWQQQCTQLISPIAAHEPWRKSMGLPEKWEAHPLWRMTP